MLDITAIFITITAGFAWINHRHLHLPPSIGVMSIAILASLLLIALHHSGLDFLTSPIIDWLQQIDFQDLLMDGMLSSLLFAGALHIDLDRLRNHGGAIACLATLGVLVSTLAVGSAAWWLLQALGLPIPYLLCLVFGALIAPTDPIAVLGILRTAGAPEDMEIKIVGESLFNDGVAVVLFTLLAGAATGGESLQLTGSLLLFLQEAGGGLLLGILIGVLAYQMMKSIDQYQVEVLITLAVVLGGYALAQRLHVSGPIAMVVAGLIIGNHGRRHAMSEHTTRYVDAFWELIDETLNTALFVLIGLELIIIPFDSHYLWIALVLIAVILLARFLTLGLPRLILQRWIHFSTGTVRILTWGGLRGGISIALALSLPPGSERDAIVMMTYLIVLFSILVQGLTLGPLVRRIVRPKI